MKEEWRWGKKIIYLSLHCHHQNDSCIKMGSDESHFNISLIVRNKVIRQCPQITAFEEKGEQKADSNQGPSAYQPNVLPLDQTGSRAARLVQSPYQAFHGITCWTSSLRGHLPEGSWRRLGRCVTMLGPGLGRSRLLWAGPRPRSANPWPPCPPATNRSTLVKDKE